MDKLNCLRCEYIHKDNGNCTAVGGFCTAVPAANCKKLKEYMDTGIEPKDVKDVLMDKEIISYVVNIPIGRLKELAQADREGRIVKLPCKVGDTVYRIVNDAEPHITTDLVCEIRVSASVTLVISLIGDRIICEDDFGKIVFLSYQEAEAALKKEKQQ